MCPPVDVDAISDHNACMSSRVSNMPLQIQQHNSTASQASFRKKHPQDGRPSCKLPRLPDTFGYSHTRYPSTGRRTPVNQNSRSPSMELFVHDG